LWHFGLLSALALYKSWGALQSAWASARLDGRETAATELRQAMAMIIDQGSKAFMPFFQGLLAEIEARRDDAAALTRIDEALALAGETGEHWSNAILHRLRGKILLKHDPADVTSAEDALLTSVSIAHQQKARSFELRAALDLARLYNSTGRAASAHALLVSALKGFSPTPEAQTLLSALAP
jgi:predicted ATPase